jgi:uncharacterized membrane protein
LRCIFFKNGSKEDIKMKTKTNKQSLETMTYGAILTALVIILQLLGSFIKFGPFSVTLVLVPIVMGAALCGKYMGAWLGLVFGGTVLLSGDAALFMAFDVPGAIITVLVKGIACGLIARLIYQIAAKKNLTLGVILAAIACPLVNTGVFILGCHVFFMKDLPAIADTIGVAFAGNAAFIFLVLVGANFLFEMGANLILGPVLVRLIQVGKKIKKS